MSSVKDSVSSTTLSSILHVDVWIGEGNCSSSVRFHQLDRRALAGWEFVFPLVPRIGEHSTTEQAVLGNDLPTALSFLLI